MRRHAAAFYAQAQAAGFDLAPDQSLWWLTPRGHTQSSVEAQLPRSVLDALQCVFERLGGDEVVMRAKTRGAMSADFLIHEQVVEHDERSHFTGPRLASFDCYPVGVLLGYDVENYKALIGAHRQHGERGFAHKLAAEFPGKGGRMRQRAYFDAFRDLAAPSLQGQPVLRVANPEEDPLLGLQRFEACLAYSSRHTPAEGSRAASERGES
jgi:hypothetical protein